MSSSLISPRDLVYGHAFSAGAQSYLSSLFTDIKRAKGRLVIVAGAGVSMNAGLPSWSGLLDNMSKAINNEVLAELATTIEATNHQRRAETIVQLTKAGNPNRRTRELVLDALYIDGQKPPPGLLGLALARLVTEFGSGARLVTTNYDDLLEQALRHYNPSCPIRSYSLDTVNDWRSLSDERGQLSVLHLHGMVRQGADALEPIIVTESHFLRYGADVHDVLSSAMQGAIVLFAGLSMTDPNLLGPLFEEASSTGSERRYALFVPRLGIPGYEPLDCGRYAVESAKFLEEKLRLRPILLKSHSQTIQVVADLALARRTPSLYRRSGIVRAESTYYGHRYSNALSEAYTRLGIAKPGEEPRVLLSRRLRKLAFARQGLFWLVRMAARKYHGEVSETENLAAFLWLRRPSQAPHREYSLQLVASSAYVHWDEWSGSRVEPILESSNYTAVQALYRGRSVVRNLDSEDNGSLWRGSVAVPLILEGYRSDAELGGDSLDLLIVGALTLDSTRYVDRDYGPTDVAELSAISAMDENEYRTSSRQ